MSALKAILFDVDDTLFGTTAFAKKARHNAVRAMIEYGLDVPEEHALAELQEVLKEFTSNYDHHFDKLLLRLSGEAKVSARRAMIVSAGVVAYHNTKFEGLAPFDDVRPLLDGLKQAGIVLGVVTHGWTAKQTEKLIRLDLALPYFPAERVFVSDTVGINKPNPKLYARALASLGLAKTPSAVMYVGDNPYHDVEPPASLGMKTVWCKRASKYTATEVQADHEVDNFEQLGDILREQYGLAL
jgi:putative hydrolase of the HAD superfamily